MVVPLITAVLPPSDRKSRQCRRSAASRNLVSGNCLPLAVIAFALVSGWFGHHRGGVDALSCLPCEPQQCPNTTDCPGGLVMGVCMCCQECARQVNESCGGPFGTLGTCDRNLHCLVSPPVYEDGLVYADEDGICQEIPELNCQGNNCPTVYQERLCPPDSYVSYKTRKSDDVGSGETNLRPDEASRDGDKLQFSEASIERNNFYLLPEETSYCACNTSLCHVPVCAQGYTAALVQNATGLPGTCCDVYQCEKPVDCNAVICPVYEEDPCPDDSVRLPSMWTHDKCCELQHGCTCPTEDKCKPVECPAGFQVQVTSRATGLPGSCCHIFRCINESVLTCIYNHQEYTNGQIWQMDSCKTCECKDGLNKCTRKDCDEPNCSWMMVPEGECCPVCRGCVSDSGQVYNESEVWKENDCTTCTCRNGHPQCQSEMCEVPCLNPISVPGQCCPECPHEKCQLACPFGLKSDVEGNPVCECKMAEDRCPTKNEEQCGKKCEYGFKRSRDGCIKCKCNKCPQFNCTKRCTHGHVLNDEGCPLCKCKDLAFPELISPRTEIEGMSCLSRQGSRHVNGESWNDGCRVCYCHNGVEMCSLIACPAPHCSNPVFEVGDCCPTCPGLTIVSPNGEKELCQSSQGHYYVEGETWKIDPCTLCVCHGGSILCQTPTCPPVLCHHPVKPEGQCCATCRGEDLNTLPVLGHHHCRSSTSMMYKHGDVWRSTPCQSCTCQDGQIHCYNQMCPPINCNRTVLKKGQCCPTCVESSRPKICVYKGVTYDSGEKWQGDNCTQCLCFGGHTECFPMPCPSLECSELVRKSGQCCPECLDLSKLKSQISNKHKEAQNGKSINTTAHPTDTSAVHSNTVAFAVFGVLILILAASVAALVYCLLIRRKQRTVKKRPKSTNLDLQGQMPFLTEKQKMNVVMENQFLEKLRPGIASEKGKGDRASNDYTEMVFKDSFLSSIKS